MFGLGAIAGDIIGSRFEFNNHRSKDFKLFDRKSVFTDDTVLTIAVMDWLLNAKSFTNKTAIKYIKKWGRNYFDAGYGGRFYTWLFSENSEPYNSFGNGSAMRISPVGLSAEYAGDRKMLCDTITSITHNHPEGMKGAEVVAECVHIAFQIGSTKEQIREYASKFYNLDFDIEELRKTYTFDETCQGSVPQAIYCFLISKDYEDCIRNCISIGGDSDTIAAIAGGIAEAFYGELPEEIQQEVLKRLPEQMIEVIKNFNLGLQGI